MQQEVLHNEPWKLADAARHMTVCSHSACSHPCDESAAAQVRHVIRKVGWKSSANAHLTIPDARDMIIVCTMASTHTQDIQRFYVETTTAPFCCAASRLSRKAAQGLAPARFASFRGVFPQRSVTSMNAPPSSTNSLICIDIPGSLPSHRLTTV